jgi:hypothetical protein
MSREHCMAPGKQNNIQGLAAELKSTSWSFGEGKN